MEEMTPMAASLNVSHPPTFRKSPISKTGVLTLYGFGIRVRMQSGHLEIEDGIGPDRRKIRLARVGHGLKRLVLIGSDGFVTLEALHWLSAQGVAFVMLERDGKVLCVTGPVRPSDARLRRSQALAGCSAVGIEIARDLIDKKLLGQEQVARYKLLVNECADAISRYRMQLPNADTLDRIRLIESQAAAVYWSVWHNLPINFPKKDALRVPGHWLTFGTRVSPITGSPRVAVNPPNAMLNYLYSLLESECRLAAAALGLDPGLGVLHLDTLARDSLACDLMEAIRPQVDAYLLDSITRGVLKREWFAERSNGNCRLASSLAIQLSETAPMWERAIAPIAEWVAQSFWTSPRRRFATTETLPTRLTQRQKIEAKGHTLKIGSLATTRIENVCQTCGRAIRGGISYCRDCAIEDATTRIAEVSRKGRSVAHTPEAQAERAKTQRENALAQHAWDRMKASSGKLDWEQIRPALIHVSTSAIARQIDVSRGYATLIRAGRRRPHPRHWQALAELTAATPLRERVHPGTITSQHQ
jgi:CRISPR-associated endonuclease Cas1